LHIAQLRRAVCERQLSFLLIEISVLDLICISLIEVTSDDELTENIRSYIRTRSYTEDETKDPD